VARCIDVAQGIQLLCAHAASIIRMLQRNTGSRRLGRRPSPKPIVLNLQAKQPHECTIRVHDTAFLDGPLSYAATAIAYVSSAHLAKHIGLPATHMLRPLASNNPWTPQALYIGDDIVGLFSRKYWLERRHAIGSAQACEDHTC
jgi:hypothetical protein